MLMCSVLIMTVALAQTVDGVTETSQLDELSQKAVTTQEVQTCLNTQIAQRKIKMLDLLKELNKTIAQIIHGINTDCLFHEAKRNNNRALELCQEDMQGLTATMTQYIINDAERIQSSMRTCKEAIPFEY